MENLIKNNPPDILITIDSPSFSYRLVNKIQNLRKKVKIFHYVAPTVWAWKKYRAKIFAKLYDGMFTLFRFENKYFTKYQLSTQYVGHQIFFRRKVEKKKKTICFLPGSRNIEIKNNGFCADFQIILAPACGHLGTQVGAILASKIAQDPSQTPPKTHLGARTRPNSQNGTKWSPRPPEMMPWSPNFGSIWASIYFF